MPRRPALHPVIVNLFDALPRDGAEWPIDARVRWLRATAAVFELVYGETERPIVVGSVMAPRVPIGGSD